MTKPILLSQDSAQKFFLQRSLKGACRSCRQLLLGAAGLLSISISGPAIASEVNKSFSPVQMNPGEVSTLTVNIFNNQAIPLTDTALTDNLPPGMTVANPSNASTTCANGTVTATAGANAFSIAGAIVPPRAAGIDGRCQFSVDITTTVQGNSINTIPAGSLTNTQNDSNSSPASATIQINSVLNPSLSKSVAPNTIFVGETALLTIRLTNNDENIALTNVGVTDNLPTNVTVAGTASTDCPNGLVSTTSTNVVLTEASIPSDTFCTVTVPITASATGSYINRIPRNSVITHQGVTNSRAATDTLAVQNLAIAKEFSPTRVRPGDPSTLTLTLENGASIAYTGISVTDTLPTGLAIAPTPNLSNTCSGTATATSGTSDIIISGASLPAASATSPSSCVVTVDVVGNIEDDYTNIIPEGAIASDQGASNFGPASAILQIDVMAGTTGRLEVEKRFIDDLVAVNIPARLRLRVRNQGDDLVTGITLSDVLPSSLVVANSPNISVNNTLNRCGTGATVTAVPGTDTITLSNADMRANTVCTFFVDVIGTVPGTYTNVIPAGAATSNEGESNPQGVQDDITISPGIEISKLFFPDRISPGGRSTLTITLTNYLPTPLTGVAVTDNLPQDNNKPVTVADANTADTTCGFGTVAAPTNGTSVSLNNGTVPAAQGNVPGVCTVQVEVTSPATSGRTDNVIPPGAINTDQGVTNLTEARDRLRFSVLDVGVIKSFDPLIVSGGSTSTLTVTLNNPSAQDYLGTTFIDTMPVGMQVAPNPNPSSTCTDGVLSAIPGENSFSLSGARVAANGSCTITLEIVSVVAGNLTNVIAENGVTTFQGATNPNNASATLTNLASAGIGKGFSPNTIYENEIARLTITILNSNPFTLNDINVSDLLPTGVTVASPGNDATTCGGTVNIPASRDQVSLANGTLAAESSCTFSVDVTSTTADSYTNTIPANALSTTEGGTNAVAAQADLTVNTALPADVRLVKRITAINQNRTFNPNDGTPLASVKSTTDPNAQHPHWPNNYLVGETDAGVVKPGDTIEYTVYFLNAAAGEAQSVRICDRISPFQRFQFAAYGATGRDLQAQIGSNSTLNLTAADDGGDRAQLLAPGVAVPANCNLQAPNTNGTVVLDVTGASGTGLPALETLSGSTGAGQPDESYGFFRFITTVEE